MNRRRAPRYHVIESAQVECRTKPQDLGPSFSVLPLNFSTTGIRILTQKHLPPGAEVRLQFSCKDIDTLVCFGKVVWSLELPVTGFYYTGVAFDQPVPDEHFRRFVIVGELADVLEADES
jgi:hypothetical protein